MNTPLGLSLLASYPVVTPKAKPWHDGRFQKEFVGPRLCIFPNSCCAAKDGLGQLCYKDCLLSDLSAEAQSAKAEARRWALLDIVNSASKVPRCVTPAACCLATQTNADRTKPPADSAQRDAFLVCVGREF